MKIDTICEYFGIENFQKRKNVFRLWFIHENDTGLCFILRKSRGSVCNKMFHNPS